MDAVPVLLAEHAPSGHAVLALHFGEKGGGGGEFEFEALHINPKARSTSQRHPNMSPTPYTPILSA